MLAAAAALGLSLVVAATVPTEALVAVALVPVGALAVFFGSTSNAHMQMWSAPHFRGRVMGIYSFLTLGSTVIGGPFVGWVCQHWNPRWSRPRRDGDGGDRDRTRRADAARKRG